LIEGCISPAIESVRSTKREAEVRCEFDHERLFVALPAPLPAQSELMTAGVPEDPAVSLATRADGGNAWCTVAKMPPPEPGIKPGWEIVCSESSIEIPTLIVVSGKSFVIRVAPTPEGNVRLVEMQP
jgi:hypothetical protein